MGAQACDRLLGARGKRSNLFQELKERPWCRRTSETMLGEGGSPGTPGALWVLWLVQEKPETLGDGEEEGVGFFVAEKTVSR